MNKKKKRPGWQQSSLHAVSSLPLSIAVKRLTNLNVYRTEQQIKRDDSDTAQFHMAHHNDDGHVNAVLTGRLQRWEGTQTRIDIESETRIQGEWAQIFNKSVALVSFVLAAVYAIGMYGAANALLWSFGIFFCTPAALGLIALIVKTDALEKRRHEAMQGIDTMMQAVNDSLTAPRRHNDSRQRANDNADRLARLINPERSSRERVASSTTATPSNRIDATKKQR